MIRAGLILGFVFVAAQVAAEDDAGMRVIGTLGSDAILIERGGELLRCGLTVGLEAVVYGSCLPLVAEDVAEGTVSTAFNKEAAESSLSGLSEAEVDDLMLQSLRSFGCEIVPGDDFQLILMRAIIEEGGLGSTDAVSDDDIMRLSDEFGPIFVPAIARLTDKGAIVLDEANQTIIVQDCE